MSHGEALINVVNLQVEVDGATLLHDVNLTVAQGQIVTLIGPNGSGKSTLARAILGMIHPTKGTIHRAHGLTVGYMPQKISIDPTLPLSVHRFLSLSHSATGYHPRQALELVSATTLERKPLRSLSGGELQRVLLAKAIMNHPQLLILDEPVQGVDVTGQSMIYGLIAGFRHDLHCGILLISHDLHMVLESSDHVVCLNKHICCEGEPKAVSANPEYKKLFPEYTPYAGVVPYTHHHDHHHDDSPDEGRDLHA